jgi:biopolymer transport protein ExbB/TolQ
MLMKSTSFSRNRQLLAHLIGYCSLIFPATGLMAQEAGSINSISDITTFWSLTKLGGGISLAIFIVLALGIFLICLKVYELVMDRYRGKSLQMINYRHMSVGEVAKMIQKQPHSLAARLYSVLLSIFHSTGNTQDFHDEIANYLQLQQDRFATFKNRLAFLSDTAGALGLLGTVWGMFVTFFGGNLDSQRILNGMGLALVTTLIGLIVSIILNFFATEVFSLFNKRIELLSEKADEFRLWLMALVNQRKRNSGSTSSNGSPQQRSPKGSKVPKESESSASLTLKPLSELKQDCVIGHTLPEPVAVAVIGPDGKSLPNVPVCFEVVNGDGRLDNVEKSAVLKTDSNGITGISWTMGGVVGPQMLRAYIPEVNSAHVEFVAFAQPFIPNIDTPTAEMNYRNKDNRISL